MGSDRLGPQNIHRDGEGPVSRRVRSQMGRWVTPHHPDEQDTHGAWRKDRGERCERKFNPAEGWSCVCKVMVSSVKGRWGPEVLTPDSGRRSTEVGNGLKRVRTGYKRESSGASGGSLQVRPRLPRDPIPRWTCVPESVGGTWGRPGVGERTGTVKDGGIGRVLKLDFDAVPEGP